MDVIHCCGNAIMIWYLTQCRNAQLKLELTQCPMNLLVHLVIKSSGNGMDENKQHAVKCI